MALACEVAMKSGRVFQAGRALYLPAVAMLLLGITFHGSGWAAESRERMEARRLTEQTQTQREGGKTRFVLPVADGRQDRLDNWLAAQAASRSIIQDNFVAP